MERKGKKWRIIKKITLVRYLLTTEKKKSHNQTIRGLVQLMEERCKSSWKNTSQSGKAYLGLAFSEPYVKDEDNTQPKEEIPFPE